MENDSYSSMDVKINSLYECVRKVSDFLEVIGNNCIFAAQIKQLGRRSFIR